MPVWLLRLARDEGGQDIVEYVLLTAFFGLCALAAFTGIQSALGLKFTGTSNGLQGLWDPPPPSGS